MLFRSPDGVPEQFDEDCSLPFKDLAEASPRSVEDQAFAYADTDIDTLSEHLGSGVPGLASGREPGQASHK